MGIFDKLTRGSQTKSVCCLCHGGAPSYKCLCGCHRNLDVEFWETVAYAWMCDEVDEAGLERAWKRFIEAYPECAKELWHEFWHRIHKTRWHHKHHHGHHHHPYSHWE